MIGPSLFLFSVATAFCLEPSAPANVAVLRAAAKTNFLAHTPGSPTVDSAARLSAVGDSNLEELRLVLQSAREIQLGCVLPCSQREDALIYQGKVELVGGVLGLNAQEIAAATRRYVPEGKPRLRPAGYPRSESPAGDKLIEGKVLERLISDGRMSGQLREGISRRALALADALGKTSLIAGGHGGTAAGSPGAGRTMTAAQIAALNALPRAQAEILTKSATKPPPPPSPAQAPINESGLILNAKAHWDAIGENPRTSEVGRMGAATMVAFIEVFNLDKFEQSTFELSASASDPGVSKWQTTKDAGAVAGNGFLAAAGFIPASAWAKGAQVTKLSAAAEWATNGVMGLFRTKAALSPEAALKLADLGRRSPTQPLTKVEVVARTSKYTPAEMRRMSGGFEAEDLAAGIRRLTQAELAQARLTVRGGALHTPQGPLAPGNYLYAMDETGAIFVHPPGTNLRHSSLVPETIREAAEFTVPGAKAGVEKVRMVRVAGHLCVGKKGKITGVNRASGHFKPAKEDLAETVGALTEMGASVPSAAVHWDYIGTVLTSSCN